MWIDVWVLLPLLSLVVPALAFGVAVAVWKLVRVGKGRSRGRRLASAVAFVLITAAIYVIGFFALWAWGSGS